MVTFSFPLFQDGVKWEIFWQWQSVRRQAREEATGSSSAVRRRCYTRGDIIFVCSMNDQVVNMNVGVPISFLLLFALKGDLATAPCLSQTTGDHFPFGFKAFF